MSSGCLGNVCPSPPYKMVINEEQSFIQISFNSLSSSPSSSTRRTCSSEMINQNGSIPVSLKRTQSSDHLNFLGPQDDQINKSSSNSGFNDEKKGAFEDIWSSIQKNVGSGMGTNDGHLLPPPYVHPLVKRSTSLLSQKSLEVCTESLGSETGSETGLDQAEIKPNNFVVNDDHHVDVEVLAKLPSSRRSLPTRSMSSSFPPPLPSLSHREGSNLHMRAHRRDGRLVVEAIPVPSVNRLRAVRHDGRLLLTLTPSEAVTDQDYKQEEELAMLMEGTSSTLIMTKLMSNARWPRNLNATIEEEEEDNAYSYFWKKLNNHHPLAGPRQNKKVGVGVVKEGGDQLRLAHINGKLGRGRGRGRGQVVVLKAAPGGAANNGEKVFYEKEEEYLIPLSMTMRRCKERSEPTMSMSMRMMRSTMSSSSPSPSPLLLWDSDNHPYCIATS